MSFRGDVDLIAKPDVPRVPQAEVCDFATIAGRSTLELWNFLAIHGLCNHVRPEIMNLVVFNGIEGYQSPTESFLIGGSFRRILFAFLQYLPRIGMLNRQNTDYS